MTQPHPMNGNITNGAGDTLTPSQVAALKALLRGSSVTAAAQAAGVSRQTCSEWRNRNPTFVAAMNASRLDIWRHVQDRLRALVGNSLDLLEAELANGDVDTAKAILVAAGSLNLSTIGESNPVLVARELADREGAASFAAMWPDDDRKPPPRYEFSEPH